MVARAAKSPASLLANPGIQIGNSFFNCSKKCLSTPTLLAFIPPFSPVPAPTAPAPSLPAAAAAAAARRARRLVRVCWRRRITYARRKEIPASVDRDFLCRPRGRLKTGAIEVKVKVTVSKGRKGECGVWECERRRGEGGNHQEGGRRRKVGGRRERRMRNE